MRSSTLARCKFLGVHALIGLHFAEFLKARSTISASSTTRSTSALAIIKLAFDGLPHFLQRCKADERVAGANVEVDVGQRLQVLAASPPGDKLEEQAELADFHGLFHDVHAVEVVDDDRLQDEVAVVGVPGYIVEDLAEVGELPWAVLLARS